MSNSTYDLPAYWPWDDVPDELADVPPDPDELWDLPDWPAEAWAEPEPEAKELVGPVPPGELVDPAVAACGQISAGLDVLAGLPADLVGSGALRQVVEALMCGRSRTGGLLARYIAQVQVRGCYPPTAAHDPTAAWLRHRFRLRPGQATAFSRRSQQVMQVLPELGQAMVDGTADVAQAEVIVAGIDRLPTTATAADRDEVLSTLIGRCGADDPIALQKAATVLVEELTTISEDGDPPEEEDPGRHARRSCTTRRVDGGIEARIFAPDEDGAHLLSWLSAGSRPDDAGHRDLDDPAGKDTRSRPQRQYDTVAAAWQHVSTCPQRPGPPVPAVLVSIDYDILTQTLSGATLTDTGQRLPASVARRLCCDAALIPAVLDGASLPLDLGRDQRLFTKAQRHALAVRDGGCSFPGCDTPPANCQAHHLTGWADGGPTDLANGTLLCGPHHRQLHLQHWTGRIAANGRPEYLPPDWIDPHQTPRQHIRYQLNQILRT